MKASKIQADLNKKTGDVPQKSTTHHMDIDMMGHDEEDAQQLLLSTEIIVKDNDATAALLDQQIEATEVLAELVVNGGDSNTAGNGDQDCSKQDDEDNVMNIINSEAEELQQE